MLLGTNWCVDSYGVFRSAALRKSKLYPNCYGCEKVLLGQLSLLGKYAHIPERLFAQRIHKEASSSMATAQQQHEFAGSRFASTRFRLLRGHLSSVRNSPLSTVERVRCYAVVARYVLQLSKWSSVISRTVKGRGVGGESLEILSHADRSRIPSQTDASSKPG